MTASLYNNLATTLRPQLPRYIPLPSPPPSQTHTLRHPPRNAATTPAAAAAAVASPWGRPLLCVTPAAAP